MIVFKQLLCIDSLNFSLQGQQVKYPEDFKTIVKYLLFSAPKIPLPVTGNMVTAVHKAIQEAGSAENIRVWCYPTPEQRLIFGSPKLVLLAPWGAGKTFFMVAEAIQKAENGEKVLFLLCARGIAMSTSKKSLLAMDLELKFQGYQDTIKVETVVFKDGEDNKLREVGNGYDHIMCDELFGDIDKLTPKSQRELKYFFSSKDSVWMAVSNAYYYASRIDGNVDLEALVKGWFPNFQVAKMQTPLRMPKTVAETIRSGYANTGKATPLSLNPKLCAESNLPSNLTEGCQIESFGLGEFKSFFENLDKAFDKLPRGSSAVIVIDDRQTPLNIALRSMIKCQHCRDLISVLTIDVALAKLGKKALYHCLHYSSPEQWVKEFLSGQREGEILVASFELMRGIEHPFIIDTTNDYTIFSRTSSKLVRIISNMFLDMMAVTEQLLKDERHQCQAMMERESRPQIDLSISSSIGGFFNFFFPSIISKILCFLTFFSDKRLARKSFKISQSLPYPQDYRMLGNNPILSCLVDQMKHDQELSNKSSSQTALVNEIITGLDTERINWPLSFNLMSSEQWSQKMRMDPKFYWYFARNSSEVQEFENLLLDLAAQCLNRKIQVIPFLQQDEGYFSTIFPRTFFSKLKSIFVNVRPNFRLLSIQKLHSDNFFISITKD